MFLKKSLSALGSLALSSMLTTVSAQTLDTPPSKISSNLKSLPVTIPDSPQEMWSRILLLLKKNGGFTTKTEVEQTFGLRFTRTDIDDEKQVPRLGAQFFHDFEQEIPVLGLVSMGLFEDPKKIQLTIEWGPIRAELPGCLKLEAVTADLTALGYLPGGRTFMPGTSGQHFYRAEDLARSKKTGEDISFMPGASYVGVGMPNQFSQCVIRFFALISLH